MSDQADQPALDPRKRVDRNALERRIQELDPWFHNLRIRGVETAPEHYLGDYPQVKWTRFQHVLPEDLEGRSVLDIGCNAGFYAMEMRRRNAGRIVAIDSDPRYLRQAEFASRETGAEIELRRMSVYDIGQLGERFDLVIFMGVLYHLRHPLLALDLIWEHVAGDLMLCQSLQRGATGGRPLQPDYPFSESAIFFEPDFPKLHFIERRYAGDPTNWFFPNGPAMQAMLRSAGFSIESHPEKEVYLCRRTARPEAVEPPPL